MTGFGWFYLAGMVLFIAADLAGARIVGARLRPIASAVFSVVWPLAFALGLIYSAIVIRRYKESLPELKP